MLSIQSIRDSETHDLQGLKLGDKRVYSMWVNVTNWHGNEYKLAHVCRHAKGPYIKIGRTLPEMENRIDNFVFVDMAKEIYDLALMQLQISSLSGGRPSPNYGYTPPPIRDISTLVTLPSEPTNQGLAELVESYKNQFTDVRVQIHYEEGNS